MRVPWLLPFLLASACGGGLAVPVPRLVVETPAIDLGEVRRDGVARAPVVLSNPGTARLRVLIATTEPFSGSTDALFLDPGERTSLDVLFRSGDFGAQTGRLLLTADGRQVDVPLAARVPTDWDGDGHDDAAAGGADCDDGDAAVSPDAEERCDGIDNDCDGTVDLGAKDAPSWFVDDDGDGFGRDEAPKAACARPPGHAAASGDCDDGDPDRFPGADERADGVDEDCDGRVDEHLLTPGSLVVDEIYVDPVDPDIPPYVELRVRSALDLHLGGVVVGLGSATKTLPPTVVSEGEVLVLCGLDAPGRVDGVDCLAPLPDDPAAQGVLSISGESVVDALDWTDWDLPDGASLELGRGLDHVDNDDARSWCASTRELGPDDRGSPGLTAPHCPDPP
jgi:hypothetical protein